MNNGLGYKLANVPTITGLSTVTADNIISGVTNTSQLIVNGVDVSSVISQVPINTNNITALQQVTTGITYSDVGAIDLTTISNNVTVTKNLKCSYVVAANDDVTNKLYVDNKIADVVASAPATLDTLNELAVALGNDPNYATSTATLIGTKVSLSANQTITGINTMNNTSNVFYGDGSHLTGIVSGTTLTTTTMPATGLYYLPYTTSSTGASGLTPYSDNQISYNKNLNTFTVPNLSSFGNLTMTNSTPIITSAANTDLIIRTPATSTGSLLFKTQDTTHFSISSAGIPLFQDTLYLNGPSLVGQNANGFNIASTGTIPTITISPNNVTALSINSGGTLTMTAGNPVITSTLTSNLTLQTVATGTGINLSPNGVVGLQVNSGAIVHNLSSVFNSAVAASRQINNTYYNLMDTTAVAGGANKGRIYTDPTTCYLQLTGAGQNFKTNIGGVNVFQVNSTGAVFDGSSITMNDGGSNNTTIDQFGGQFNISNNVLNNTTSTMTGIIPSLNTSCIVRTDAVTIVAGNASVSSSTITGTGGWNAFSNNFFVTGTNTYTIAVAVLSLTTVQLSGGVPLGSTFTSFIGTRFALGTYISSGDLGLGVYSISQNALVSLSSKDNTTFSLINLNRPFTAGGALTSTITLDYNTTTNIQCLNTSSLSLNAISIKPKDTISDVTLYGNLRLQGSLLYNYGFNISTSVSLVQPLAQFYTMTNTTAITITLPTASATITGTSVIFKRYASSFATTFNQVGGATVFIPSNSLSPITPITMAATTYQTTFISAGTYWFQML